MKKSLAIVLLLSASVNTYALDLGAVLGGALGGGAGAAVGQNVGGKNGAIIGGAIGGGAGAAIGSNNNASVQQAQPAYRRDGEDEHRHGHDNRREFEGDRHDNGRGHGRD